MYGIIDINGKTTPLSHATLPPLDRGFLYGESIFETLVAFSGQIIHAKEHINRLSYSATCLNIDIPWKKNELLASLSQLVQKYSYDKTYIRLVITGGNGFNLFPSKQTLPNKITYLLPAPKVEKEQLSLQLNERPYTLRTALPKTPYYLPSIIALKAARKNGFDDILWLNSQHELTETSTANLFLIKETKQTLEVLTPCVDSGIIAGTLRKTIIDLLRNHHISVQEKRLFEKDLTTISAAFTTSSIKGLIPITTIGNYPMNATHPGFHKIKQLFLCWFNRQVNKKMCWNTGKSL